MGHDSAGTGTPRPGDAASDPFADLRQGVRAICADFPDEYWRRCDAEHEFPWDFYGAFASAGWGSASLIDYVERAVPSGAREDS
ncbi:MAG: hypothetical protein ACO307_11600, partial [Ilumatobacteraceae bacterium]